MKMLCCIAWLAFVWLLYCLADCLHGPAKLILQIVATLMLAADLILSMILTVKSNVL